MQKYPTIDQINAEPKAKPETEPQWGQTSETVTSMPPLWWPSTEATAATLAALVVITSFCSRCGCSSGCCCCCCCCVPCRSQGQQKKKKAARGFLAARAICGLSTRSTNNENAFQLLLLPPRCASLTGAANGPSRLVICIQHQLNRFLPEPIIDAATSLRVVYAVKTVIYAWFL